MKPKIISALFLSLAIAMPAFGVATPSPNMASFTQEQLQAKKKVRDPVRFQSVVMVNKPKALLGDSSDPRCPNSTVKCFAGVDDLLYGRRELFPANDLVFSDVGGILTMLTANSTVTNTTYKSWTYSSLNAVVSARLFNAPSDILVRMDIYAANNNDLVWTIAGPAIQRVGGDYLLQGTYPFPPMSKIEANSFFTMVAGDFTGDGYDEVVVFLTVHGYNGGAIVMSAVDPNNVSAGVRFGPAALFSGPTLPGQGGIGDHAEPLAITKATVLGKPRVIAAGPYNYVDGNCASSQSGLLLESYAVDPTSLAITSLGTFKPAQPSGCLHDLGITSGRFSTGLHDQLALVYGTTGNYQVMPLDFDTSGNFVQGPTYDTGLTVSTVYREGWAGVAAKRFAWNSATDQVALFASGLNPTGTNSLRILSFDQNWNVTAGTPMQASDPANLCAEAMVAGNFDRKQANPSPPPATLANPNPQVAVAYSDCASTLKLRVYDVDSANNYMVSQASEFITQVTGTPYPGQILAAPDWQGRSLVVGEPDVITINNHNQPSVILAAPPMHADYVAPIGSSTPKVLNISAGPDGFYSSFIQSNSNDYKTTTTNDTTWSFAAQETVSANQSLGSCDDDSTCEKSDIQASAKQALDGSNANTNGNFYTNESSLSIQSSLSDEVLYQNETRTIYVYPAIGRFQCPTSLPNCSDDQKTVPLVVNMSGSDTITTTVSNAADLTWYQPTWIPGNILSYPQTLSQLQAAAFPGDPSSFQSLGDAVRWSVSGGVSSQSLSWTNGSNSGSTSSFNRDFSFDFQVSVYGQVGLSTVVSGGAGASLDVGGSFGLSTLTDTMTTLSQTQGLNFTITAKFAGGDYDYYVTPYVFGQTQPGGVVDGQPLSTAVQTYGALRMGHVVDFESCGLNCFWKSQYGQQPDLALNQPKHWASSLSGSDKGDGSCITFGSGTSDYDCVTLGFRATNPQRPGDIGLSEYHTMRGLFIQGPSGTGPQVGSATVGDQLVLTARVYNLSLAEMPVGSTVHARFMAFPWNTNNGQPAGKSYTIGEQTMAPIPAFNSLDNPGAPNYALISQPFNTNTACGGKSCDNQDLAFWVAVWAEDGSGNLMTEMSDHGLTSIPAITDDFFDVGAREGSYSNNLGLYDQVFHVFSKPASPSAVTANAASLAQSAKAKKREVGARLTQMGRSPGTLRLGSHSVIAARVKTGSREFLSGLTVQFYDGHPDKNGRLFGQQTLPYLKAKSRHDFRANYRPQECGRHRIFALVGKGTRQEHLGRMPAINVKCTKAEKASFPPKT